MAANATANVTRNLWSYVIIFCGHFPDGAMHFTEEELEDETRAEWYLRQMLGSANFEGGPLLHILSGNLGFQIEHHLFPDLPSNRYAEISVKVRALCDKYDIPYTIGPLHRQYGQALRTIIKLVAAQRDDRQRRPGPAGAPRHRGRAEPRPQAPPRRRAPAAASRAGRLVARRARAERPLMDAAPRSFDELPRDAGLGVPVPFACGSDDPYADPDGPPVSVRDARQAPGHPVRAQPRLRVPAAPSSAGRWRCSAPPARSAATRSCCRPCTSSARAPWSRRTPGERAGLRAGRRARDLAAGDHRRVRVRAARAVRRGPPADLRAQLPARRAPVARGLTM